MNVFEEVQKTRPEIDGADENISAARARLLTEIHAEKQPARSRSARRPWIITAGLVGAAAAVTAGVLVVGNLTAPMTGGVEAIPTVVPEPSVEPTPEPSVEPVTAQSVLAGAANTAAAHPGPVAGPGQYLKIENHLQQLVLSAPGNLNPSRAEATAGWTALSSYTTYIPADASAEWVRVFHADLQIADLYGDGAAALSQDWLAQFSWREESTHRFPNALAEVTGGAATDYSQVPRDPAAMLAWIRGFSQSLGVDDDTAAAGFLIQELQLNAAPMDLRVAMYQALSLVPNGVISGSTGSVVTLSFPLYEPNDRWDSISIDTSTALVVSSSITLGSGGTVVPDGVPNGITTQTISVVDDAP